MSIFKQKWSSHIYPWIIWTLGAGFFFYKYLVQVSPSVMTDELMQAFHIHGAGLGNLSAYYFYAYLIMQIPVGILLDKYSPRLLTASAIFLCSISTFIFSGAYSLELASFARAMMGAGAAFAAVSCFKLATLWFKPNRFALVSGLCMTAAMLGGVFGQMPLSLLVQSVGWRSALQVISVIGIALGIIYILIVRDKPGSRVMNQTIETSELARVPWHQHLRSVFTNPQTWLLSLYSGLAFAPVSVFGGLWGVPFLQTSYALTKPQAAFAVSSIFIGFALGAPFFGWLSDYVGRRKPILFFGTLGAFIAISIVLYVPNQNLLGLSLFLFLFGFGASGFFTSFAMIRELFSLILAGTILGFMNTFDSICEALFEPLVGALLDFTWEGKTLHGVHQFSIESYHLSLSLLPLSLLISIILLYFIKETYCIPIDEHEVHQKD
ncbi:MAG: MFS transporter [Legionellaceae bacterium]